MPLPSAAAAATAAATTTTTTTTAYGPADSTATQSSLASLKSRLV